VTVEQVERQRGTLKPEAYERQLRAHDTAVPGLAPIERVKPPVAMKGPHALFVAQAKAFVTKEQSAANKASGLDV